MHRGLVVDLSVLNIKSLFLQRRCHLVLRSRILKVRPVNHRSGSASRFCENLHNVIPIPPLRHIGSLSPFLRYRPDLNLFLFRYQRRLRILISNDLNSCRFRHLNMLQYRVLYAQHKVRQRLAFRIRQIYSLRFRKLSIIFSSHMMPFASANILFQVRVMYPIFKLLHQ